MNSASKSSVTPPQELFEKSLTHEGEYLIEINGVTLWQHPEVLSQEYSQSSIFATKNWDITPGMMVLDIGTGNGVMAIFAALRGARRVVATDVNPFSEAITKKNINYHALDVVTYIESDVFDALSQEKFDRVIFNAPNYNAKADSKHPLTYALNDENYSVLEKFLRGAKNFLAENGKVLLGFSSNGDVKHLETLLKKYNFNIEKIAKEENGKHTRLLYFLKT